MLRSIYSAIFYLLLPFILLRLWWKGRRNPAYRRRWRERLGAFTAPAKPDGIWVHAVSVGEVIAAIPLIKQLRQQYPEKQIIVTTMTPTGSARVQAAFGDDVFHVYVPYDVPCAIKRFLARVKPCVLVIMETELWPNLLPICSAQQIPIVIANARLSHRSTKSYLKIKFLMAQILRHVTCVAAQTQADGDRYLSLGLPAPQLLITGNIKFDIQVSASVFEQGTILRAQWGQQRPVWIAASTHEGEEELVLAAFAKVRAVLPDTLLVLVPRHPERFEKVINLCRKQGYQTAQRSAPDSWHDEVAVFVGDTMGELLLMYVASDVAFVGGSLVPVGGHNLLEPAAVGVPSLTGPHMFNFVEINRLMQEAHAVVGVHQPEDLAQDVIAWLQNKTARQNAAQAGKNVVEQNRGALARHMELLARLIK